MYSHRKLGPLQVIAEPGAEGEHIIRDPTPLSVHDALYRH